MNRWHIRKDMNFPSAPWFLTRDNWEDIDPNTDLACIEGGSFETWEWALKALEQALRLDQYVIDEHPT